MTDKEYFPHEAAVAFPMLDDEAMQALTDDIARHGLRVPIVLLGDKIIDGRNRYEACKRAGVEPRFTKYQGGDDPYMWVWSINAERRHLSSQEQKYLIWKALHGMSEKAVEARRKIQEEANKARGVAADTRRTTNGTLASKPTSSSTVCTTNPIKPDKNKTRQWEADEARVNKGAVARAAALEAKAPDLAKKVADGEITYSEANRQATGAPRPNICASQGTGDEYYTPKHIVDMARDVMGTIDVDPASNDKAQKTVKAGAHYTRATNGLDKDWVGNVWMNPPYSRTNIDLFCNKLVEEIDKGNTTQACTVTHNVTGSKWARALFSRAAAVCFLNKRLRFLLEGESVDAPTRDQMVCYFGDSVNKFHSTFSEHGTVMVPVRSERA